MAKTIRVKIKEAKIEPKQTQKIKPYYIKSEET